MTIVEPEDISRKGRVKTLAKAVPTPAAPPARGRKGSPSASASLPPATGAERPLVILTESSVKIHSVIDEKTQEIQRFRLDSNRREYVQIVDDVAARSEARTGRYILQQQARRLLSEKTTPRGTKWRVTMCHRSVNGENVAVLYSDAVKRAHYGNLMVCGSVWTCPSCAAKVSERRKAEVVAASDLHAAAGGGLSMMTYTFAHKREDKCVDLVKRLRVALTWMRKQTRYKKIVQYAEFVGLIRALEVTHGEVNGWHPHVHELWLTKSPLSRASLRVIQNRLFDVWRDACSVAGLGTPNRKAGVTCIEAYSGAQYVAKFGRETSWGTGSELTKAHTKKGRSASRTPFDLLRLSADGVRRCGDLFVDFANAFFGSRQLYWSPGLKSLFQIEDITDEEAASMQEQDARVVCLIDKARWKLVLAQPYELRGVILDLAENGGADAVNRYLDSIEARCTSQAVPKGAVSHLVHPSPSEACALSRASRSVDTPQSKNADPLPFWLADAKRMLEQASDLPPASRRFLSQLRGIPSVPLCESERQRNGTPQVIGQGCFDFSPHTRS